MIVLYSGDHDQGLGFPVSKYYTKPVSIFLMIYSLAVLAEHNQTKLHLHAELPKTLQPVPLEL